MSWNTTNTPLPISPEGLQTLKCSKCQLYLSVGPILINSKGLQCGRCKLPADQDKHLKQAVEFEVLAKLTHFPCRFDIVGCKHVGQFTEILYHEEICKFKTFKCPSIEYHSKCHQMLHGEDVVEHFKAHHKALLLSSPIFKLSGEQNYCPKNYIIILNEQPFLLQIKKFLNKNKTFKLSLHFLKENFSSNATYQIKAFGGLDNMFITKGPKIRYYQDFTEDSNVDSIKIELEAVESVLATRDVSFRVLLMIPEAKNKSVDFKLIEQLECPICLETLRPPIYSCATGHSVCFICKINITRCPLCKREYLGARNFAVENLVKNVEFKCRFRNEDCVFVGCPDLLENHEKVCPFRITRCTVYGCKWQGSLKKIDEHLKMHNSKEAFYGFLALSFILFGSWFFGFDKFIS